MGVKTDRNRNGIDKRLDPGFDVGGEHSSRRIGNVNYIASIGFKQLCLLDDHFRRTHVGKHQETERSHANFFPKADMLLRNVGFSHVRSHSDRPGAAIGGHFKVLLGPDSRKQQHSEGCASNYFRSGRSISSSVSLAFP